MTALHLPPKNLLILAAVGIGALWLNAQRKAAAAQTPGQTTRRFFVSPAATAGKAPSVAAGMGDAVVGILNKVLTAADQPLYRPAGYTPGYFPDTQGEAQAAAYAKTQDFIDATATNPPSSYVSNDGVQGGTGGFLDSQ